MAEEIITSTNAETATDHEYNASEIQVLKGLEAVRKRPGMYIGSTGERGLHHLVYEIVDNAIDEALAGYCDHIEVKILKGDIIQVTDNGRGIPVDIQADTGLPAVTVVYTILHAGGKFGGENSGYKVAGGLHGVGASVVNACSEWLTVNVRRDGHEYEQTFRRGDPDGPLKCIGTVDPSVTGTRVTFKPDPEMFKDTTVYNFETLEKRLREESFLNAGVKITLTDERELYTPVLEDGKEGEPTYRTEVMCYEGGINAEFIRFIHALEAKSGVRMIGFGHAGDGNVHLCVMRDGRDQETWDKLLHETAEQAYEEAYRLGGVASGEHGIGLSKRSYFLRQTQPEVLTAMNQIKNALDPKHVLNDQKSYVKGETNHAATV